MKIEEKVKKSFNEEALKRQRALAYLKDIAVDSELNELDPLFIDIRKNELNLEILRSQQIRIDLLRDQNEKDALTLNECIEMLADSAEKQLDKLMSVRIKIADEVHKTHEYMQKLNNLSNIKEIDTKIKKFSELSDAFQKISTSLSDEKIAKIISILAH